MNATRRGFIGGAAAFAPFATRLWAVEAPLLKIGVMTDTHVGKTKESCSRARLAYEMFRDLGVDLVANVGDVADHHYPTGYTAYREMVEETFAQVPAANRPQERISTPVGDSGVQRYVMEFAKPDAAYTYALLIREGTGGRIRFEHVKIERL